MRILSNAVVLAAALLPLTPWPAGDPERSFSDVRAATLELLDGVFQRLRVSRRDAESARQLMLSIRKMAPGFRARRFSRSALAKRPYFPELLTLFSIYCRARNCWMEALQDWQQRLDPAAESSRSRKAGPASGAGDPQRGGRRRRGGGGRKRGPPAGSRASGRRS